MKSWPQSFAQRVAESGIPNREIRLWVDGGIYYCQAILVIGGEPQSQTTAQGENFEEAVLALIREFAARERERREKEEAIGKLKPKSYPPKFRTEADANEWAAAMNAGERKTFLEIAPLLECENVDGPGIIPNPEYENSHFQATTDKPANDDQGPPLSMLGELPPKFKTREEAENWIKEKKAERRIIQR